MIKGMNYDVGFVHAGISTHEPFDPAVVAEEMRVIRDDLGCTAVRITGGDPDRLEVAARHAATAGLSVWWCPFLCDVSTTEATTIIGDCAGRAERLRGEGAEVVLLAGAELSLFADGFLPGKSFQERASFLAARGPHLGEVLAVLPERFNAFLGELLAGVRERFTGQVGYSSLPFEGVDWAPFDLVATDAGYRSTETDEQFRAGLRALHRHGKPTAVTEFGCTTHAGGNTKGGHGTDIVEWDGPHPIGVDGDYARDEAAQAAYLLELLTTFDQENVHAAFVYTFANYHLPRRSGPRADLDLASAGVVAVLEQQDGVSDYPGMGWSPKAAFHAVAGFTPASYADH